MLTGAAREHVINHSGKISKPAFKATVWTLLPLAVLCTVARFAIRAYTRRRPSLDDYFVLLATAALATSWGALLQELDSLYIVEALNDHEEEIVTATPEEIPGMMSMIKWYKIFVPMVWLSIFAVKGAFLVLFHVLIRQISRTIYLQFWIVVVFNAACWMTLSWIDWAVCPYVGEKAAIHCSRGDFHHDASLAVNTVGSVLDIVCDLTIISIPVTVLSLARMGLWQKISYAGVLCLSVAMIIVTLTRMIGVLATRHKSNIGTSPAWAIFWEIIEACIAVIMASFVTFRSVFAKGGSTSPLGEAKGPNDPCRWPGKMGIVWERLLSKLGFRHRYQRSPSALAENRESDREYGVGGMVGEDLKEGKNYVMPTGNATRPTLMFSRLRTLFGSMTDTRVANETSDTSSGTVDVLTESDLRELDYHRFLGEGASSSSGVGSSRRTGHREGTS